MHMDNSVVIAGERGIRGLNGNRKNIIKMKLKKKNVLERESMCNGPVVQKKQGMFRATLDFRDYWRKKAKRAAGKAGESKGNSVLQSRVKI